MKHMLLGVRVIDFKDKQGVAVDGVKLYVAYESGAEGLIGQETADLFINAEKCPEGIEECVGTEIDIEYNRRGKVASVSL